jgi:predicted phage terminase large subunit-like protein
MNLSWSKIAELAAEQFSTPRRWATPGELAQQLDPRTRQTPALDLIDEALVEVFDKPDGRLIISMPPQEGKSTRAAKDFPIWALTQNRDLRIVTASYGQDLANRNGRAIRDMITRNANLLGFTIARDNGAVHEWTIAGREGGVLSVGIGAGVTGRAADMLVIDDPIKDRKEADSATFRQNVWDWWTDAASTRLAPGAPVVLILTRWHEDDLAGRLLNHEDGHLWRVINIPAQSESENDPLGRPIGEYMRSARDNGRRRRNWEAIKVRVGSRTWASLYQGRPAPAEGGILKRDWWREYSQPLTIPTGRTVDVDGEQVPVMTALDSDAELIQSWDMAFKATDHSDFVVGQVWLRRGANAYLLDQVRGRFDFPETVKQFRRLSAKWPQAVLKIVEDKANGPAVIASLANEIAGIVPEQPDGSKEARASAVAAVIEAGNVWLPSPDLAPWIGDLIEEAAAFPNGAHDDQVDALTQALKRLLITPLLAGDDALVTPEDMYGFDELDYLSPTY